MRDFIYAASVLNAFEHNSEFVAAQSCDEVCFFRYLTDAFGCFSDCGISDAMSPLVINRFQLIHIDEKYPDLLRVAGTLRQALLVAEQLSTCCTWAARGSIREQLLFLAPGDTSVTM